MNDGIYHNLIGFNFRALFLEALGWDRLRGTWSVQVVEPGHVFDEPVPQTFTIQTVAQKRGVSILHCLPGADGGVPSYATRCRIQHEVVKLARENVVIYTDQAQTQQIWQWVRRATGEQPQHCEHEFQKPTTGAGHESTEAEGDGEPLIKRLSYLTFSLSDEERLTLTEVVQRLRKAFYNYRNTNRRGSYSRARLSDYDIAESDPSVQFWVEQVYAESRLSWDEEHQLARRMAEGDHAAREKFIRAHLYVVSEIAWRLYVENGLTEDQFLDLVQRGNVDLVRLADRYDYTRGGRFRIGAAMQIHSRLFYAAAGAGYFCYIPRYVAEHVTRIIRHWDSAEDALLHRLERTPTEEEIAAEVGGLISLHPKGVLYFRQMTAPASSWELEREEWEALEDEEDHHALLTRAEPTSLFVDPYPKRLSSEAAVNLIRHEQLEALLNKLTPRERDVLWMRFGLEDGIPHTLEEVGQRFAVTRERVRQIELRALKKLRRMGPVPQEIEVASLSAVPPEPSQQEEDIYDAAASSDADADHAI